MFNNNGVLVKNSDKGKRKIAEFRGEINLAVGNKTRAVDVGSSQQHLDGQLFQVQRILNNTAPLVKPFSYMSLLTAPDEEEEEEDINSLFENTKLKIDQKISLHTENLKHSLEGVLRENLKHSLEGVLRDVEERAARRVEKKEEEVTELEKMVEHQKTKAEWLEARVRRLEQTKVSLRRRLREGAAGRYLQIEEEEGESSFEDTGRVRPVILECKVCRREMARMMLWPCRHVCVCITCEATIRYCPVCAHIKTTCVEAIFPL